MRSQVEGQLCKQPTSSRGTRHSTQADQRAAELHQESQAKVAYRMSHRIQNQISFNLDIPVGT